MDFNLAQVHEAIAAELPDRECIVHGELRLTWTEVTDRTRRLANVLIDRGLRLREERDSLLPWQSGQDHVALYLYNGNEFLEGMLGAYKARLAPFNVNYRYVEDELAYVLADADAKAIIYHASLAPILDRVRDRLPNLQVLLQVPDDSGHDLLDGADDYETALANASPDRPNLEWSPDDLYILYTGGTTGMPKGVLWRQADIFGGAVAARRDKDGGPDYASLEEVVAPTRAGGPKFLPAAPFMHGSGQWLAFYTFHLGGTVVLPPDVRRLDPAGIWETVAREHVLGMGIVGDAFARPLLEELDRHDYSLGPFMLVASGGALLSPAVKEALNGRGFMVVDTVGSSETGAQGENAAATTGTFSLPPATVILDEGLTGILPPQDDGMGWLAKYGRIPLGYLGDEEKTKRTFPEIGGIRYAVPGDRARHLPGGKLELVGRDAVTINTGGEKVFAEEVELALTAHPAVRDAVVVGRSSEQWGQEVVALIALEREVDASEADLREFCAGSLARYKVPKAVLFVDEVVRSPAGKADYRWAKEQATAPG